MKRIKTVVGYQAHARLWREIGPDLGWIPTKFVPVRCPYLYSPTRKVSEYRGVGVVICETAHRRYEVWSVPAVLIRKSEADAEEIQFRAD